MPDNPKTKNPGDEVPPGTPQSGENICRACNGSGRTDNGPCSNCGGTGTVTTLVGDA
jgi:DnaJ-class molecular chaperone